MPAPYIVGLARGTAGSILRRMRRPRTQLESAGLILRNKMRSVEQFTINTSQVSRTPHAVRHLTSGSLLARNTVWNLTGQVAPMAAGLLVIPKLIRALGTDRFGALS